MLCAIILIATTSGLSAQSINLNYVKVDSTFNVTENSCSFMLHINGLTAVGFRKISYGPSPNFNLNSTASTLTNPVADTTIVVTITGLLPLTTYSYQAKILPGAASGTDVVRTFTTLALGILYP